jgi:hypothetical protein
VTELISLGLAAAGQKDQPADGYSTEELDALMLEADESPAEPWMRGKLEQKFYAATCSAIAPSRKRQ